MDFNKIFQRVKNLLISPAKEWEVIKGEQATVMDPFTKYAIFLAAIPAIAGFIGWAAIGVSISAYGFSATSRVPVGRALLWAIFYYVFSIVGAAVMGILIDVLATSFGAVKDQVASMKTAVYANTAAWVGGIFFLIPSIRFFAAIAGLYSLYLLYLGLLKVKNAPQDKAVGYLVVLVVIFIVLFFLVSWLTGAIAFGDAPIGVF